jgi:hypothetical protein
MMFRTLTYLLAGLLVTSAWIVKAEAQANGNPTGGNFAVEHPRRNEVTLNKQEAQQLRANDRAIKQQEHADVKANGGYLTGAQQKQINQEENANSQMIRDEKHPQQ